MDADEARQVKEWDVVDVVLRCKVTAAPKNVASDAVYLCVRPIPANGERHAHRYGEAELYVPNGRVERFVPPPPEPTAYERAMAALQANSETEADDDGEWEDDEPEDDEPEEEGDDELEEEGDGDDEPEETGPDDDGEPEVTIDLAAFWQAPRE